ncbi:Phycobilisome protein [Tumidithrix helvetica PCC 7403]|uniref:phycobilisome protein n=1 Tax=Tumidithrix helvetica TaxID=3457545 RepID=UPI003CB554EF
MITLLEDVLKRSYGTYVNAQDFQLLDNVLSSWQSRKAAYNAVKQKETEIVEDALNSMRSGNRSDSKLLDDLGSEKCQRDLTLGLRYCALAMLLQDDELLKDRFLYWQQNILSAMQHNYPGYKLLGQAVKSKLPIKQAEFLVPYLDMAEEMINGK